MDNSQIGVWDALLEGSRRKQLIIENGQQKIIDCDVYCSRPVLGKIVVLPRRAFQEFFTTKKWACVSVMDTFAFDAGMFPTITEDNRLSLIRLGFDDISRPKPGLTEMNKEQAQSIWEFVDQVWDKIDLLVVHCNAGMCRSPAIAKAISDKYQPKQAELFDQLYHPNKLVYQLMTETRT